VFRCWVSSRRSFFSSFTTFFHLLSGELINGPPPFLSIFHLAAAPPPLMNPRKVALFAFHLFSFSLSQVIPYPQGSRLHPIPVPQTNTIRFAYTGLPTTSVGLFPPVLTWQSSRSHFDMDAVSSRPPPLQIRSHRAPHGTPLFCLIFSVLLAYSPGPFGSP